MKKVLSILLVSLMLLSCVSVVSFAGTKAYEQPFAPGTQDCENYRIPSIITLNDGSVLAAADLRYGHGSDSPGNLDTLIAKSADGYTGWKYNMPNYFDDYAHGYGAYMDKSASFIDPAMVQDSKGTIYLIVDAFPSGGGAWECQQGTGHIEYDGEPRLALTDDHNNMKDISAFEYVLGEFRTEFYGEHKFAPIIERKTNEETGYFVDEEFRLYDQNGGTLWMKQVGSEEETEIQQNIFYDGAKFCVQRIMHLWLRTSEDGGETWSHPTIITPQVKEAKENFFGAAPGKGFVTTLADGTERIIFCVYDNSTTNIVGMEQASTIYSDDGGKTWHRGERLLHNHSMHKTSESQIVKIGTQENGADILRMYSRNKSNLIGYADSYDGGVTWTVSTPDKALDCTKDCMVSFINYNKKINGKDVLIASYASSPDGRADGVVRVGLINADKSVSWGSVYHLNQGFFAYSCLTILPDGNIGILGEHQASEIVYTVLTIDENGNISEINGDNADYAAPTRTFLQKIGDFFRNLIKILRSWFGVY